MKNECSIVCDLLPLYAENILSEETSEFVKEHLESCAACSAEFENMKTEISFDKPDTEQLKKDSKALVSLKKELRKILIAATSVITVCVIILAIWVQIFPIYRISKLAGTTNDYNFEELKMIMYIGNSSDRAEAQQVMRMADAAFSDCEHTFDENKALYGTLSRYAMSTDIYPDVKYTEYSLELWSAHLEDNKGYLCIYYSQEGFDSNNNCIHGSFDIVSVWEVEKNEKGTWVVANIKEHA